MSLRLFDRIREKVAPAFSNVKGNVQAITNPQTRGDWARGVGSSINQATNQAVQKATQPISNFFEPSPEGVRPRDVVRELGNIGYQTGKAPVDFLTGFYKQYQDTESIQYPDKKPAQRYTETPVYEPQNLSEKLGAGAYQYGFIPWVVGENIGTNQVFRDLATDFNAIPQVEYGKRVIADKADDLIARASQKLNPIDLTFQDLRDVTTQGGTPYQQEQFSRMQDLAGRTGMSQRDFLRQPGQGGSPLSFVDDLLSQGKNLFQRAPAPQISTGPVDSSRALVPYGQSNFLDDLFSGAAQRAPALATQPSASITQPQTKFADNIPSRAELDKQLADLKVRAENALKTPIQKILENIPTKEDNLNALKDLEGRVLEQLYLRDLGPQGFDELPPENYVDEMFSSKKEPPMPTSEADYGVANKPSSQNYLDKLLGTKSSPKPSSDPLSEPVSTEVPPVSPDLESPTFKDYLLNANTIEDREAIRNTLYNKVDEITQGIDDLATSKEAGEETKLNEVVQKIFDLGKERAKVEGWDVGEVENYFTRMSPERVKQILTEGSKPDTFGSVLTKPLFAHKRTDADFVYEKGPEAVKAYIAEATKNIGVPEEQMIEIKNANELANEISTKLDMEADTLLQSVGKDIKTAATKGFTETIDAVSKIQSTPTSSDVPKTIYTGPDQSNFNKVISSGIRSVADRAELAGNKYYDAFFKPFRYAQIEVNKYKSELKNLSQEELLSRFTYQPTNTNKDYLIAKLGSREYKNQIGKATDVFKENVKGAEFAQDYLKDLTNEIFHEFVGDSMRADTYSEKVLATIRRNQGRSLVAFNVSSSIQNLFELPRGFALVKKENAAKGIKRVLSGEKFTSKYGVEEMHTTELERSGVSKIMGKIDDVGYAMFQATENLKDEFFLAAFEEQGIDKGLSGEELTDFVIKKFDRYAIKYGKGQTSGVYKNPIVKTALQFGQYSLKEATNFADQLKSAATGDKGAQSFLKKYMLFSAAKMAALKATIGTIGFGGTTGTPLDLVSDAIQGEFPWSPVVQVLSTTFVKVKDELTGDEKDEYEKTMENRSLGRAAAGMSGATGINQFYFKSGKSLDNILKGEHETMSGNVANPTSQDPFNIAKMLAFGPSYDPQRQDYIDRYLESEAAGEIGQASLDKNQSAVFRNLPKDQKEDFYYSQIEEKKAKSDTKKALEKLDPEKEQGFLSKLFSKKDEQIDWTQKPTTKEERKALNSAIKTSIDAGVAPPKEVIREGLFDGATVNKGSFSDRKDVYKTLHNYLSDEFQPDEQTREALLEAADATKEDYEFYELASTDQMDRLNMILETGGDFSDDENFNDLIMLRRKVGGREVLSNGIIDDLYRYDRISKDQKDFLKKLQFDELKGEFYGTGKFSTGGSGSGSGKRLTYNQLMKLYEPIIPEEFEIKPVHEDYGNIMKFIAQINESNRTGTQQPTSIESILAGPNIQTRLPKDELWFEPAT